MKLLAVSLLALLQGSKCFENSGNELIQSQINNIQLKLTELLDKIDVLLHNQVTANNRLTDLTGSLDSNHSRQTPSNESISTVCVLIRSFYSKKYLTTSTNYDAQRRRLSQQSHPEQWTLFREAGNRHRITRRQGQEDLYAAYMAYGSERRRIFTWIPGSGESQGRWEIEEAPGFPGKVHIRSWYFAEYLYASTFNDLVFTWIPKGEPENDQQYVWEIEQC